MEQKPFLMNSNSNPLTLPTREPRRTKSLNMRLSEAERAAIDRLAELQGVTASELARHFLLQAVAFYNRKMQVEGSVNEQP
jgi:transposase-like protein